MKLRFESWYQDQSFPEQVNELFKESVLCYKVGAYKAAVITSYLGMQSLLKDRILYSGLKPDNIHEVPWERIKNDLRDDTKWDNTIFDCVNRAEPNNPFLISGDLRVQYTYWRTIRNDCAHAKNNLIAHSHVESIWLFIESNIHKFLINGGKIGLLEKIKKHYDIRHTPEGTSEEPLVKLIPQVIKASEISDFLEEVYGYFEGEFLYLKKGGPTYKFWYLIIHSGDKALLEASIDFIKSNLNIFFEFLELFPEILTYVIEDEAFIRLLWTDKMWRYFRTYSDICWPIIEIIVNLNKVRASEYDIINKQLVKIELIPPTVFIPLLKKIDYFDKLKSNLFDSNKLTQLGTGIIFGNNNWNRIKFYLENGDVDETVVCQLNSAFNASSYGTFHDNFKSFIQETPEFKGKYKTIAERLELSLSEIFND